MIDEYKLEALYETLRKIEEIERKRADTDESFLNDVAKLQGEVKELTEEAERVGESVESSTLTLLEKIQNLQNNTTILLKKASEKIHSFDEEAKKTIAEIKEEFGRVTAYAQASKEEVERVYGALREYGTKMKEEEEKFRREIGGAKQETKEFIIGLEDDILETAKKRAEEAIEDVKNVYRGYFFGAIIFALLAGATGGWYYAAQKTQKEMLRLIKQTDDVARWMYANDIAPRVGYFSDTKRPYLLLDAKECWKDKKSDGWVCSF